MIFRKQICYEHRICSKSTKKTVALEQRWTTLIDVLRNESKHRNVQKSMNIIEFV